MSEKIVAKSEKFDNTKYWVEFGIDLEKRRIMLDEDIDEYTIGWVIRALRRMVDANMDSPIDIYINTFGGSCYDGLALYDVLEGIRKYTKIRTHAMGKVMSMGFVLFLAGNERYATPRTRFMMHSVSSESWGKLFEMDTEVKEVKLLQNLNLDILAERTKKTRGWWQKEIKYEDKFYSKEQAIKFGIVNQDGDDFGWALE